MNITIIDPRYPYGKSKVFMNMSAISIAARLMAMSHRVNILDLNLDDLKDSSVREVIRNSDIVGVTNMGAPYIPGTIELCYHLREQIRFEGVVVLGGQVIEHLTPVQFKKIFKGLGNIVQIRGDGDLAQVLGCGIEDIPSPESVSFRPVFKMMSQTRLTTYFRHEGTLIFSQGCKYWCKFCCASKGRREQFRMLTHFEDDLRFVAEFAHRQGLAQLEFYASSLDFFQNPQMVEEYLKALVRVQEETGIRIFVRCLTCMGSFIKASQTIPDFGELLEHAGLWCIGFGMEGADESVWRSQNKNHNRKSDINRCLTLCDRFNIRTELTMSIGFEEDTLRTLFNALMTSIVMVKRYSKVILRPFIAKEMVPGNEGWKIHTDEVERILDDPSLFYNLDFCSVGSRLTHKKFWHRLGCNFIYIAIIGLFAPRGRCATSLILPQGGVGIFSKVARAINRFMPFDR